MKICTKCGVSKPLSDFYKDKSKSDGLKSNCKSCSYTVKKTPIPSGSKNCWQCKTVKPISAFYQKTSKCIECSTKKKSTNNTKKLAHILSAAVTVTTKQKTCILCKETKDIEDFADRCRHIDGLSHECKSCLNKSTSRTHIASVIYSELEERQKRLAQLLNNNPRGTK